MLLFFFVVSVFVLCFAIWLDTCFDFLFKCLSQRLSHTFRVVVVGFLKAEAQALFEG